MVIILQAIDRSSDCDKYPILRAQDLFALLDGREKFKKLDLSLAYQQMVLNPESRSFLAINTHN